MELKKNSVFQVTIESCSGNGAGVARIDGLAVFVPGVLPGERCEIKLVKVLRHMAYARLERILQPSPARRIPDCPYYPTCGGCVFWHMTYEAELEIKRLHVENALLRIGGFSIAVPPVLGSEQVTHYRNKAQFPVAPGENVPNIGFYRARSHAVVPVSRCLIQSESANAAANAVRLWMEQYGIPAYDERSRKGLIRHLYVRTNQAGESLVCLIANGTRLPHTDALISILRNTCPSAVGILLGVNQRHDNVILGDRYDVLWGQAVLMDNLNGLTFQLSVPSFYQVNHAQTLRLYQIAISFAGLTGQECVLDLYCGVGTISLTMARYAKNVIGVEIIPEAVEDAKANAIRNEIFNADFFCADAGLAARQLIAQKQFPDVIVVDPPRKGLDATVIQAILQLKPSRIVYISCDPGTLSRDLKLLSESCYTIQKVQVVDMFPRTAHVESVVLMSKVE